MALYSWNAHDHFKKIPPIKLIAFAGKTKWDSARKYDTPQFSTSADQKTIFIMPSFGRHGRWGNTVFQYLFIRILAQNNDAEIELNRDSEYIDNRMFLYNDMANILNIQTKASVFLLDCYQLFIPPLHYIPINFWRAMYVSNIRQQKCFFIENTPEAINNPFTILKKQSIELEGLFIIDTKLYQQHKDFILNELFKPNKEFSSIIQKSIQCLGQDKTIIGIHIRNGDFVLQPLDQSFQIPIPVKYIIAWLVSNIPLFQDPVIYVCSDDENAYKEIEMAGFEVFHSEKLFPETNPMRDVEQLDWEILRKCNVLLTSNSSFSFSAAFLNSKNPACYRFSLNEKAFVSYDPWKSDPLQQFIPRPYLWSYLYSRFTFVSKMVSNRKAFSRLYRDTKNWMFWKITKPLCLYYIYGFSFKSFGKLINVFEFFQLHDNIAAHSDFSKF